MAFGAMQIQTLESRIAILASRNSKLFLKKKKKKKKTYHLSTVNLKNGFSHFSQNYS